LVENISLPKLKEEKRLPTMYKNNNDLIAKTKVSNYKNSTLKQYVFFL
jgi:hypothetical protein